MLTMTTISPEMSPLTPSPLIPFESTPKCYICESILPDEDLKPYSSDENAFLLCRKHWCECLPEDVPWQWIRRCEECNDRIICRGCYRTSNCSRVALCLKCYRKDFCHTSQNKKWR